MDIAEELTIISKGADPWKPRDLGLKILNKSRDHTAETIRLISSELRMMGYVCVVSGLKLPEDIWPIGRLNHHTLYRNTASKDLCLFVKGLCRKDERERWAVLEFNTEAKRLDLYELVLSKAGTRYDLWISLIIDKGNQDDNLVRFLRKVAFDIVRRDENERYTTQNRIGA